MEARRGGEESKKLLGAPWASYFGLTQAADVKHFSRPLRNVMTLRLAQLVVSLAVSVAPALGAQTPNPVNLWSVELHWRGDRLLVGQPEKLTHNDGTRKLSDS